MYHDHLEQDCGSSTRCSESPMSCSVSWLKTTNICRAAKVFQSTFAQDPVIRYVRNRREQTFSEATVERFLLSAYLLLWTRTKIALTVKGGVANIIASPPASRLDDPHEDKVTKFAKWLVVLLVGYRDKRMGYLEEQRRKEVDDKCRQAVKRVLGDRTRKMWFVEELWTAPANQGHGHGGALLDTVTAWADWDGRSTWLQSSNTTNTAFYNRHGFEIVETVLLGNGNPTWSGKPIAISIMVREPKWPPSLEEGAIQNLQASGVITRIAY